MHKWFRAATWAIAAVAGVGLAANVSAKDRDHHHAGTSGDTISLKKVITLPRGQSITSFDISWVDPNLGLYFLGDRTNASVIVVDTATNQVIDQLSDPNHPFAGAQPSTANSGPDGVVTGDGLVWVGDAPSLLKTFDEFTGGISAVVSTGGLFRVDEGCFDPKDHVAMFANNADSPPFATLFDATKFPPAIIGKLTFNGSSGTPVATNGIEQCQWSSLTGNFYVSVPEVNGPGNNTAPGGVTEITPKGVVVNNFTTGPVTGCAGPAGMAIDAAGSTVMEGCGGSYSTVALDATTGKIIATINDEGGADEIYYNSGDDTFYFANSGPVYAGLQRLGIVDNKTFTPDVSIATGIKSGLGGVTRGTNHSVAADSGTNQIYVPISSTSGGGVCSSGGGNDAVGCIAVFAAP